MTGRQLPESHEAGRTRSRDARHLVAEAEAVPCIEIDEVEGKPLTRGGLPRKCGQEGVFRHRCRQRYAGDVFAGAARAIGWAGAGSGCPDHGSCAHGGWAPTPAET